MKYNAKIQFLGISEMKQSYALVGQIRDLSQRLLNIIEEGQRSVSPQFIDLVERYSTTVEDFRKQLDLMAKYNWDFDHYLEEDVPAAVSGIFFFNIFHASCMCILYPHVLLFYH